MLFNTIYSGSVRYTTMMRYKYKILKLNINDFISSLVVNKVVNLPFWHDFAQEGKYVLVHLVDDWNQNKPDMRNTVSSYLVIYKCNLMIFSVVFLLCHYYSKYKMKLAFLLAFCILFVHRQ